jgi:hypothetical protein
MGVQRHARLVIRRPDQRTVRMLHVVSGDGADTVGAVRDRVNASLTVKPIDGEARIGG